MVSFWKEAFKRYLWVNVILFRFSSIISKYIENSNKEAKPSSLLVFFTFMLLRHDNESERLVLIYKITYDVQDI